MRLKPPSLDIQDVAASEVIVRDDWLILLDSKGEIAGVFLLDWVQSWSVPPD